jgi:hypothetical protein
VVKGVEQASFLHRKQGTNKRTMSRCGLKSELEKGSNSPWVASDGFLQARNLLTRVPAAQRHQHACF